VAHEINNPLGVILGYTRLLQKQAAGEVAVDLKVIEDEALQCQRIVEGLLDLSRPIRLAPEQVQLRDLCEEVTLRLRESGQLEGVQVLVRGAAVVEGDAHHLRQIALNLVKNAAEALGAHGTIAVSITSEKGAVHLAVADDGPGLSADLRERIFEPFFTTKPSGTGLGLAVSQALARAHGGGIEAASAAGGGAVFTLRLPLPAPGSRA
jgi:two-component system NtrC family sensor kinase